MWPPSPADTQVALHPLAEATTPACGGKARNLARLVAAGLPVPDGFVVDDSLFRARLGVQDVSDDPDAIAHAMAEAALRIAAEPPAALDQILRERGAALGPLLAIRSSARIEDGIEGAAPGVFSSSTRVEPRSTYGGVIGAWMSALTPLAAAYARRRGADHALPSLGVIVQRFVEGTNVVVYTRPPGQPTDDAVLVQRGLDLVRLPRTSNDPIVVLSLRAEAAIDAARGADVELVEAPDATYVVQARPIVHPTVAHASPPPPMLFAPLLERGGTWTWDITHNPDPLSTAQTWLVKAVDAAGVAPYALEVCAGFLYSSPRGTASPKYDDIARDPQHLAEVLAGIEERLTDEIEERRPLGVHDSIPEGMATGVHEIDEALARYIAFYAIWAGELSPLVSAVKRRAHDHREGRPSSVEATLFAAARGEIDEATVLRRIGRLAPAWDIAAPTYAERPAIVRAAIERAKVSAAPPSGALDARGAADLAERDGHWFAEAQWMVRRAFLAHAQHRIAADDVFWLPIDQVRYATADEAKRKAAGARAAASRAAQWEMPLVVPIRPRPPDTLRHGDLVGVGSGGRARGRVVKFATLARAVAVGAGDVIVTRAVTPALAVMVVGCAALISETGGLLDHGAAMARELGIPCVVGCADAWTRLDPGAIVEVDGDAGRVSTVA